MLANAVTAAILDVTSATMAGVKLETVVIVTSVEVMLANTVTAAILDVTPVTMAGVRHETAVIVTPAEVIPLTMAAMTTSRFRSRG